MSGLKKVKNRTFSKFAFVSKTSREDGFDVDAHWSARRVLAADHCEAKLASLVMTSVEYSFKHDD